MRMTNRLCLLGTCFLAMALVLVDANCNYGKKRLKVGQYTLMRGCGRMLRCGAHGLYLSNMNYRCPTNTVCVSTDCQCKPGFTTTSRDSIGMVKTCRSTTQCVHDRKNYKVGEQWLSNDCRQRYQCVNGLVQRKGGYRCPSNSKCYTGRCKCNDNFTGTAKNGMLVSCKATSCKGGGLTFKIGGNWLSRDCRQKYSCTTGGPKAGRLHRCPDHSRCDASSGVGKCVCGEEYMTEDVDTAGYLVRCKPKVCRDRYNDHKLYSAWLANDCGRVYTCTVKGFKIVKSHRCPHNSHCVNPKRYGECKCNEGYIQDKVDDRGFLAACRGRSCSSESGTKESGKQWLDSTCTTRNTCADGVTFQVTFKCPPDSTCQNGECKCVRPNARVSIDKHGIVMGCDAPVCQDRMNMYQVNQQWLANNCRREYRCTAHGTRAGPSYRCPPLSHCNNVNFYGVCVCNEGTTAVSRDSRGYVTECAKYACKEGGTTYGYKNEWLQNDCKVKYQCTMSGKTSLGSYNCPENSACDGSGKCKCKEGYKEEEVDKRGFLVKCQAVICKDGDKTYQYNQMWLSVDCKKKQKCTQEGTKTVSTHACPSYSGCYNGQCKCRHGLFSTGSDDDGFLLGCTVRHCSDRHNTYERRSSEDKLTCCHTEINYLAHTRISQNTQSQYTDTVATRCQVYCDWIGRYWLANNCGRKYTCTQHGTRRLEPWSCPANSHCDNSNFYGVCKCNKDFTGSRDARGYLQRCHKLACSYIVDARPPYTKVYGNDEYWLDYSCRNRFHCDGGRIKKFSHSCPANSKCQGWKCDCNKGYEIATKKYNMVSSCRIAPNGKPCTYNGKTYKNGDQWVGNYCHDRLTCLDGEARSQPFSCPANSECMYHECRCAERAKPAYKDSFGITKSCGVPICTYEGITYKEGDQFLSKDCKKKLGCFQYGIRDVDSSFRCPYNSYCSGDRKCVCNQGFSGTSRDSRGFLQGCRSTSCNYNPNGGSHKIYNHGDEWYQIGSSCKLRIKCVDTKLDAFRSGCPANSSCRSDACVCNTGYKETGKDSAGLLSQCGPA